MDVVQVESVESLHKYELASQAKLLAEQCSQASKLTGVDMGDVLSGRHVVLLYANVIVKFTCANVQTTYVACPGLTSATATANALENHTELAAATAYVSEPQGSYRPTGLACLITVRCKPYSSGSPRRKNPMGRGLESAPAMGLAHLFQSTCADTQLLYHAVFLEHFLAKVKVREYRQPAPGGGVTSRSAGSLTHFGPLVTGGVHLGSPAERTGDVYISPREREPRSPAGIKTAVIICARVLTAGFLLYTAPFTPPPPFLSLSRAGPRGVINWHGKHFIKYSRYVLPTSVPPQNKIFSMERSTRNEEIWASFNAWVLRAGEGEVEQRRNAKPGGTRDPRENPRWPVASSGMIPTCEKSGGWGTSDLVGNRTRTNRRMLGGNTETITTDIGPIVEGTGSSLQYGPRRQYICAFGRVYTVIVAITKVCDSHCLDRPCLHTRSRHAATVNLKRDISDNNCLCYTINTTIVACSVTTVTIDYLVRADIAKVRRNYRELLSPCIGDLTQRVNSSVGKHVLGCSGSCRSLSRRDDTEKARAPQPRQIFSACYCPRLPEEATRDLPRARQVARTSAYSARAFQVYITRISKDDRQTYPSS
ncbi:hypothetical protein PR048_029460 [Dryococelus australis]|uniref:Uncharacterized protein n=1 Tax=Dryococelus australis TaxID=614101 RepID=A0ABQ9GDT5_9NEOP|nr:hypothetical protein PR048_029460 [Dryococelus australis]